MTNTYVRYGALGALLALSMACSERTSPTAPILRAPTPMSPLPDPTFPAVLRPARVYVAVGSRFVFYEDGTFALQYSISNGRPIEYPGTYSADGTNITLHFGGASAMTWGATGTLTDDSFTVKYNDIMQHSDFVDALYTRDR